MSIHHQVIKIERGSIVTPAGFKAAGIHSGVKKSRKDLGMILCERPANAAAVYTTNVVQAAPLQVTRKSLEKEGKIQAVLINSGNANACTGKQGLMDAEKMRDQIAAKFNFPNHYVAVASTGVIGEPLPMDVISKGIDELAPENTSEAADHFNQAILTTDTITKTTCYQAVIKGKEVTMAGSAKGSGMIAPNMATMLAFLTTDLVIEEKYLQKALKEVVDQTFNCITVDGDTSTNDHVLVMASGFADHESLTPADDDWPIFIQLLTKVCEDLAKMIARDGEGATKLIEVEVMGAKNDEEAVQVAKSVVGSSLVKTAVYGEDPNWGRILCAIGYSGAVIQPETIDLYLGPIQLLKHSQVQAYCEEKAKKYLMNEEIQFKIDLKIDQGKGKGWGCDLTYDYIQINASYRT